MYMKLRCFFAEKFKILKLTFFVDFSFAIKPSFKIEDTSQHGADLR